MKSSFKTQGSLHKHLKPLVALMAKEIPDLQVSIYYGGWGVKIASPSLRVEQDLATPCRGAKGEPWNAFMHGHKHDLTLEQLATALVTAIREAHAKANPPLPPTSEEPADAN